MDYFLYYQLWGNEIQQYAISMFLLFVYVLVFKIFQLVLVNWLERISQKTKNTVDDLVVDILEQISPPFYFLIAFYFSFERLVLTPTVDKAFYGIFIFAIVFEIILALSRIVDYIVKRKSQLPYEKFKIDKEKETVLRLAGQVFKMFLWVLGFIFILSNLGVDVGSLITGVGVGGIIIALAVKDVLGDFLASLSIFLDKPFEVGDYIRVSSEEEGAVERITFKTTHLKNLKGQKIIITNKRLSSATIENFQSIKARRGDITIGVSCGTSLPKLKKIPLWIEEIIEDQEKTNLIRVIFNEIGEYSFNFRIVFKVTDGNFSFFQETKSQLNYKIIAKLRKERIDLAFPAQVVVNKE